MINVLQTNSDFRWQVQNQKLLLDAQHFQTMIRNSKLISTKHWNMQRPSTAKSERSSEQKTNMEKKKKTKTKFLFNFRRIHIQAGKLLQPSTPENDAAYLRYITVCPNFSNSKTVFISVLDHTI